MKTASFRLRVRGFTIIELSVSLAIMGMMMVILLYNYPDTAIRMSLANISHTTSLLIREAQVRGSAIDSGNTNLDVDSPIGGYGVYASLIDPGHLILFSDFVDVGGAISNYQIPVGDGLYQHIGLDETSSITTFPNGYIIAKLCIWDIPKSKFVCNGEYSEPIQNLTISFMRPNPEPNIYINDSKATNFSAGCIELYSPHAPNPGHIRSVEIFNSGMIRTEVDTCDKS